jgi:hypothetical protein
VRPENRKERGVGKKRVEIIIETERVILVKRRFDGSTSRCDLCGALASTPPADDAVRKRADGEAICLDSGRGQSEVCPRCGNS